MSLIIFKITLSFSLLSFDSQFVLLKILLTGHLVVASCLFSVSHKQEEMPICKLLAKFSDPRRRWSVNDYFVLNVPIVELDDCSHPDCRVILAVLHVQATAIHQSCETKACYAEPRSHWCSRQMIHRQTSKYNGDYWNSFPIISVIIGHIKITMQCIKEKCFSEFSTEIIPSASSGNTCRGAFTELCSNLEAFLFLFSLIFFPFSPSLTFVLSAEYFSYQRHGQISFAFGFILWQINLNIPAALHLMTVGNGQN